MSNHSLKEQTGPEQTGFNAPLTTNEGLNAPRVTQSDFANATDIGASPTEPTYPIEGDATEPAPPPEPPPPETPVPDAPAETPPPSAPPETPAPSEPMPVEPTPDQPDVPPPTPEPEAPQQPDELPPIDPAVQ